MASPHTRPAIVPLPFPFLILCWRIGLGGQWVRGGHGSADRLTAALLADPSSLDGRSCRERRRLYRTGMARLLTCEQETQGPRVIPVTGLLEPSRPPESSDPWWQALRRCLDQSRLVQRVGVADPVGAQRAASATLGLLLAAPGPARTRSVPPLWRPLAEAVGGGAGALYVPLPRPRYDPLTWTLLDRLLEQWETEGLTFVGHERRQLYLRLGTRRMARTYRVSRRRALACGRVAYRIWRHWYETRESPRVARVRAFPLPPALDRVVADPARVYRAIRRGRRRGEPPPYTGQLPGPLRTLFLDEAERSIASFPPQPTLSEWPVDPLPHLARALGISPLAARARGVGLGDSELGRLTAALAASLLKVLTAPWPWRPRR